MSEMIVSVCVIPILVATYSNHSSLHIHRNITKHPESTAGAFCSFCTILVWPPKYATVTTFDSVVSVAHFVSRNAMHMICRVFSCCFFLFVCFRLTLFMDCFVNIYECDSTSFYTHLTHLQKKGFPAAQHIPLEKRTPAPRCFIEKTSSTHNYTLSPRLAVNLIVKKEIHFS